MEPIRTFKKLFHLGTLNPKDKGIRGSSYEGHGLSVSTCPDAWRQIAKLGGLPCWLATKPENKFLHYHRLTAKQTKVIEQWGLAQGLVIAGTQWVLEYYSSETDSTVYQVFDTEELARAELYDSQDPANLPVHDPDGSGQRIFSRAGIGATEALHQRLGQNVSLCEVPALLAVAYAESCLAVDGVFWNDVLDPDGYSAPRAVIFPGKLDSWKLTPIK